MNMEYNSEFSAVRHEIEVRLIRETIYRAVEAFNTKVSLEPKIKENDEMIARLGEFLLANGSVWEAFLNKKKED